MIIKPDWISFSVPVRGLADTPAHFALRIVLEELYDFSHDTFDALTTGYEWTPRKGRPPYSQGWTRSDNGCFLFFHPRLNHFLVEISGDGCEALAHAGVDRLVVSEVAHRVTRLDLACDMLTDTDPLEFVARRSSGRFKSHSEFVSDSGVTAYVGSRTSNRYARVYRYNPPHERAHLLRCEFVVKAEDAKLAASYMCNENPAHLASELGNQFGWQHPAFDPFLQNAPELTTWKPEKREGKTLFWLNDTVAKTLVRLHQSGTIDATVWLRDNVLSKLEFAQPD